jgi:hypothetical protein
MYPINAGRNTHPQLKLSTDDIDTQCNQLTTAILKAAMESLQPSTGESELPYTYALRDSKEYMTAKNETRDAWNRWKNGLAENKEEYKSANKRAQIIKNSILRTQQEKQWRKTEQQIRANPGHIFKLLRKTGKKATRVSERPSMVQTEGTTTSDPEVVAQQFHEKWGEIFGNNTTPAQPGIWLQQMQREKYDTMLKRPITLETLQNKIRNLKKNKAAGADQVHNEYLTHLGEHSLAHLQNMINNIIKHNHIPKGWRNSITTMLYKKGDKT